MKYSKLTYSRSVLQRVLSIALMAQPSAIALATFLLPLIAAPSAQAVPLPKDWCGRIWGVQSGTGAINWDVPGDPTPLNPPNAGTSNLTPPPGIAPIPALPSGGDYATLGIHAASGTLYSLARANSILYTYNMSTATGWTPYDLSSQIPNINSAGTTNLQVATVNFNKMTVTRDNLIIASSTSAQTFTYALNPVTGAPNPSGTAATYTYSAGAYGSTPGGNPVIGTTAVAGESTRLIGGGDIAQDEYGDTYNLTYDNLSASTTPVATGNTQYIYFYKKVGNTWEYRARLPKLTASDTYAGFAVYNDALYAKGTVGQLFKISFGNSPRTGGVGGEYNWASAKIDTIGGIGTKVADLATCGVPALNVIKTQSIYTDAAGTTLTPAQNRIGTGQYIKYTITITNQGDAWARGTSFQDPLPAGVTYVLNSATQNGLPIPDAATSPFYPFADAPIYTPTPNTAGVIPLPFNGNVNTSVYTFVAKVIGNVSVANKATVSYTTPYPSEPPNCATGLNCNVTPLVQLYPSIFGTVWNDKNGSAAGTFSNIFSTGEIGTNTGAPTALYALLLNSTGNVLLSSPVANDGTYGFPALDNNQNNLKIQLSTTPGTVSSAPPAASIPTGWKATSPKAQTTTFNLATADVTNQDFGISLPAGTILVKRITGIKPAGSTTVIRTTNPNDGTSLNPTTFVHNPADAVIAPATTSKDQNPNWPTNYIVGAFNAGITQPGDEIEYTIYYLNSQGADTKNLNLCDPIRGRQSYVAGTMQLQPGASSTPITLTDTIDATIDRANAYGAAALPAVVPMPTNCNAANASSIGVDSGGVAVQITGSGSSGQPDLPALPSATVFTPPTTPYGWFRFRTKVNN